MSADVQKKLTSDAAKAEGNADAPEVRPLHTGFTTGACAAAGAVAAWSYRRGGRLTSVELLFPDGHCRCLPVASVWKDEAQAQARIIKDAGDDIDITDRATLVVTLSVHSTPDERDHVEACGQATVAIRAGEGVGVATRLGLDVPSGKWAINPGPRRMIVDNLLRSGLGAAPGSWLVEVAVEDGAALARKTLNPVLGIQGGLSILGTTGIVVPCSHAAYEATIRVLLRGAALAGAETAVLVTGGRSQRAAQRRWPEIPEYAFVQIGDFIRSALGYCAEFNYRSVNSACMPGKLAKYARGHEYTHAHVQAMEMAGVAELLGACGVTESVQAACRGCQSMREFLETQEPEVRPRVIAALAGRALVQLRAWAPPCRLELVVFTTEGECLGAYE